MPKMPTEKSDGPEAGDSSDPLFADHHALLIGVSKYQAQDRINWTLKKIPGASCDAKLLRKTLESVGYPSQHLHCLCDEEATLEAIQQKIEALCSLWKVTLLTLFWGGHGVFRKASKQSFLLPYGADLDDLHHTAISVDEIILQMKSAKATNKAIFFDTCHSAPNADRLFLPEWNKVDPFSADPALTFVGASTYLALETPRRGGILTSCLRDAFTGCDDVLYDGEGAVALDDVMIYLQRHLVRRARAAWEEGGKCGEAPQYPYILRQLGNTVPVGRNVALHVRSFVKNCDLPEPMRKLAAMVIAQRWPEGNRR